MLIKRIEFIAELLYAKSSRIPSKAQRLECISSSQKNVATSLRDFGGGKIVQTHSPRTDGSHSNANTRRTEKDKCCPSVVRYANVCGKNE